jgi:hypothetical protein
MYPVRLYVIEIEDVGMDKEYPLWSTHKIF